MTSEEIQAIFFAECEESLAAAEAGLAACQAGTHDDDTINSVFRAVHSVKGGAGAFGYVALQAYTHTFETLLSAVREGTVPIGDALVTLLLRALDTLADHVVAAREGGDAPDDALLLAELTAALGTTQTAPEADAPVAAAPSAFAICDDEEDFSIDLDSLLDDIGNELAPPDEDGAPSASAGSLAPPTWTFRLRAHADAMANGSEPLLLLRELASLGATCVGCDIGAVPPIDEIDPCHGYLGWTFAVPGTVGEQAVMEIFDFAPDDWGWLWAKTPRCRLAGRKPSAPCKRPHRLRPRPRSSPRRRLPPLPQRLFPPKRRRPRPRQASRSASTLPSLTG